MTERTHSFFHSASVEATISSARIPRACLSAGSGLHETVDNNLRRVHVSALHRAHCSATKHLHARIVPIGDVDQTVGHSHTV